MIRLLGAILGFIAGSLLRIRRRHVEESMDRIGVRASAGAMYRALGTSIFELLWVAAMSKARRDAFLDRHVDLDPIPEGAAILGASHTGNWEIVAAAVARRRPLFVVAKPFSSSWFDGLVRRLRARLGIRTIEPRGATQSVIRALRAGALVVMPIDQVPDRPSHAVRATFLGEPAYVDRAPFVLARRAGVGVVVCAAHRDGNVQRVRALGTVADPGAATALLDAFVRQHPQDWMWLHRRWKQPALRLEKSAWTTHSSSPVAASRAA